MAWDASRPVPYRRLFKEWLIYAAIMSVIFLVALRDSTSTVGLFIGLLVSLPLYIGLSYVLAKLGYRRKSLAEMRAARTSTTSASTATRTSSASESTASRSRPAPTRRTSASRDRPAQNRPARKRR